MDKCKNPVRSLAIFNEFLRLCAVQADQMFGALLLLQWAAAVLFAVLVTPLTWIGPEKEISIHVYASIFGGGLLTLFPLALIWKLPGAPITRHVIATAQIMYSVVFIHLTGGRIETHFHVFGSIAFLVLYRDNRVLWTAAAITVSDHILRGLFFPQSVYGVLQATPWRAFEHGAWVTFEVIFLMFSNRSARNGIRRMANIQTDLEEHLNKSQEVIDHQQQSLIVSAKQSALGEMAGQIAHEINTPLGAIVLTAQGLRKKVLAGPADAQEVVAQMDFILRITTRLTRITSSMRKLAGLGENEPISEVLLKDLIDDTLVICESRLKKAGITFILDNRVDETIRIQCRQNEIAQVLVNLMGNASDAVKNSEQKWIKLEVDSNGTYCTFRLTDSGPGIAKNDVAKLFLPRFTTKTLDSGTGLGLAICKKLVEHHHGRIYYDATTRQTTFVFEIPFEQTETILQTVGNL